MAVNKDKIVVVTDSVADIPDSLVKKYDIRVVPLYVNLEGKSYREHLEIDQDRIYSSLLSGTPVKTATPTINDFLRLYRDIKEKESPSIIYSIHLSAALSGTLNAASAAAAEVNGVDIRMVDSKKAAIGQGFVVLAAAAAARQGAGEEEIDSIIKKTIDGCYFYATFDNFEYVVKGGRAPFLAGFVKKVMLLKAVITFRENGSLGLKRFCINRRSALTHLYRSVKSEIIGSGMGRCIIGICYGNDAGPALILKDMVENDPDIEVCDFVMSKMTSVMAVHTGPGIWGIAACPAFVSRL